MENLKFLKEGGVEWKVVNKKKTHDLELDNLKK